MEADVQHSAVDPPRRTPVGSTDPTTNPEVAHRLALGNRISAVRRSRGVPLQALRDGLGRELSLATFHAYEAGERRMSVQRLAEICDVLGIRASELLAQVERDLAVEPSIWVRTKLLTSTKDPELAPLAAWTRARISSMPLSSPARRHVEFGPTTLREAARVCALSTDDLRERLRTLE